MTLTQYNRLRNKAANRLAQAFAAGNRAFISGDWRACVKACKENDAAYLNMCRVMERAREVTA